MERCPHCGELLEDEGPPLTPEERAKFVQLVTNEALRQFENGNLFTNNALLERMKNGRHG